MNFGPGNDGLGKGIKIGLVALAIIVFVGAIGLLIGG